MTDNLSMNVQFLKGIGEVRSALFSKLGIVNVGDLITFYPRSYEDWRVKYTIQTAPLDEKICIQAHLAGRVIAYKTATGAILYKCMASDSKGIMQLIFFNNKYVAKNLTEGEEFLFYGKMQINASGAREMLSPAYMKAGDGMTLRAVYRQTENLTSRTIGKAVKTALDSYEDFLPETLPQSTLKKYNLLPLSRAIHNIHFPRNESDIESARRRLIFEELLVLQLGLLTSRTTAEEYTPYAIRQDFSDEFAALLPFKLTSAQKNAVGECIADMKKDVPMGRLLQGDVGSGKTAVAASLIYTAVKNGGQCALMAPTEVLANQHYDTLQRFFSGTGIKIAVLTGSIKASEKKKIKESVATGETDLVIGTHAILTQDVTFSTLSLVITDEQHRFGVRQRAALRCKGNNPHVLVMSATPIPRTLSLIIFGDLDISVLNERPAGRIPVKTYCVPTSYRKRLYAFIKKQIDSGRQGYIVCPLAKDNEEEDESGLISAEKYYKDLSSGEFKNYSTGLLHGQMRDKQKNEVMKAFSDGSISLLICTVVIEVGIDVPNADIIVIENAERFGLSQLHQLRGRTGRGNFQSYCVLVSDSQNTDTKDRLAVLCSSDDGFKIADEDLKMRGPGDFFGARQSGLPVLKIADLMGNSDILSAAGAEARAILSRDEKLTLPENAELKKEISKLFADIS